MKIEKREAWSQVKECACHKSDDSHKLREARKVSPRSSRGSTALAKTSI